MPVPGLHNQLNALAACAVGEAFGLAGPAMLEGLRVFKGLPHRFEWVRMLQSPFTDSKATNRGCSRLEGVDFP